MMGLSGHNHIVSQKVLYNTVMIVFEDLSNHSHFCSSIFQWEQLSQIFLWGWNRSLFLWMNLMNWLACVKEPSFIKDSCSWFCWYCFVLSSVIQLKFLSQMWLWDSTIVINSAIDLSVVFPFSFGVEFYLVHGGLAFVFNTLLNSLCSVCVCLYELISLCFS